MSIPVLLLGNDAIELQEPGAILIFGEHYQDQGADVKLRAKTAEVAVAGVAGRASFLRLFVAVTFDVPFTLRVQPIVDGKNAPEYAEFGITSADFAVAANGLERGVRATHLFEIALSLPYSRDGVERFRTAMQGCYFQAEITQPVALTEPGELIVEQVELEYKVLTKSGLQ